jgi:muconate cycloisomerase
LTFVSHIDVLTVELPFRFSFGHALAERSSSTNVLVRLALADGSVGWGEGVPREYVTGETVDGASSALAERLAPALLGATVDDAGDVPGTFQAAVDASDAELDLAARCALELAFLDACGKHFRTSLQRWLGAAPAGEVRYDAVIPFSSPRKLVALALVIRAFGIRQVKIKVGDDLERDLRSLELLRRVLGQDVDLRVDANCAWTPAEAVEAIERMGVHRIAAVEQPVAGEDVDGLRTVSDAVSVPVIADESLRTVEEARRLAETKACGAFNIRVSKCGGLLDSMRIARIADEAGIFCVVGAQVGESGILSAAGRHAAAAIAPRYLEGSGGSLLLKRDLTEERVLPGRRGRAHVFGGHGLGVRVREELVEEMGSVARVLEVAAVGVS